MRLLAGPISTAVVLIVVGFLACFALRRRESLAGWMGVGYLGSLVAGGVRNLFGIQPIPALGVADPLLWAFVGSCLVISLLGVAGRLVRRGAPPVSERPASAAAATQSAPLVKPDRDA
jgi:uncharacterized membrane protein YeaQ/YmgE (transglycosylase-associated protein family)